MTATNQSKNPDQATDQAPELLTEDFSWETLPEVAKDRWEEMVAYSSTVENQLSKAKASRSQAETELQRIATETLNATKDACRAVVADSKRAIAKLKGQKRRLNKTSLRLAGYWRRLKPSAKKPTPTGKAPWPRSKGRPKNSC